MDKVTEDEEITKLLDVKDIEFIETSELIENNENDKNCEKKKLIGDANGVILSDSIGDIQTSNGELIACTERRSDEPTELEPTSFEKGDTQKQNKNQKRAINATFNNVYLRTMSYRFNNLVSIFRSIKSTSVATVASHDFNCISRNNNSMLCYV